MIKNKLKTILIYTGTAVILLAAGWYVFFGLKAYDVTPEDIETRYSYQAKPLQLQLIPDDMTGYHFSYQSFDGAMVNGYIRYPQPLADISQPVPVLIGAHAMGRAQVRWWQDSYKERPTLENTDKITAMALAKGYAVVTIDARNHGERKDPELSISDIIDNLHWWGERQPYENMLIDTVRDHRVLLDWLSQQPQFDQADLNIAGYSMGGHISLLLAAVDPRIHRVLAIVPPHIDNKTAIVAPKNMLAGLADNPVWLLSANDDEYASKKQNKSLFSALPNSNKQHVEFAGGHLLPATYPQTLESWF